jgi:hypothetical protein
VVIIVCLVALAIVAIDALRSRARLGLRTRAAQAVTKRPSHHLTGDTGSGGWRSLEDVDDRGERGEAAQVADSSLAGLDRIIGRNNRR